MPLLFRAGREDVNPLPDVQNPNEIVIFSRGFNNRPRIHLTLFYVNSAFLSHAFKRVAFWRIRPHNWPHWEIICRGVCVREGGRGGKGVA